MIDYALLRGTVPERVIAELRERGSGMGITTYARLAHFLAQVSHESGGFKRVYENLNYSEERLLVVFKKYFDRRTARLYARKPEMIANRVYANRGGNGDEKSGDGWRYRGRGFLQLTLKDNYAKFAKDIRDDVVKYPDLVATKYALTSACWFFMDKNIFPICDRGVTYDVVKAVTLKINGGYNGLEDRWGRFKYFASILKIL